MSMKTAAQGMIVAAFALIGDYSTVATPQYQMPPFEVSSKQNRLNHLRKELAELNSGWMDLDRIYSEAVQVTLKRGIFEDEKFLRNSQLLSAIRVLESGLRDAVVPVELSADHLSLRRTVAKTRNRLATLDTYYRQFFMIPEEFESAADSKALRALADHTTRRIQELA